MKRIATVLAAALALGLAACETPTPYQPLATSNSVYGGFSDQKLDDSHFRITFQGNDATSRDVVENYLLYRAAELTVNQGFDWFEMVDRKTHTKSEAWVDPGPYDWHPYWRFHRRGGWGVWDPYWGDPWAYDVQTIDRYQAIAEVGMGHGPKPADDAKAFDAHAVMANLGDKIVRPK
jgi:hypothetical protein